MIYAWLPAIGFARSVLSLRSLLVALTATLMAASSAAQTTTTYTYDALGRLISAKQGSSTATEYSYDAADNRKDVTVNGGPTVVADFYSIIVTAQPFVGDFYVLSNDVDPNFPDDVLTITGVTGVGSGNMTIQGGGTYLRWSGTGLGTKNLTYTIKDSRNLTASGSLQIEFTYCPGGVCP